MLDPTYNFFGKINRENARSCRAYPFDNSRSFSCHLKNSGQIQRYSKFYRAIQAAGILITHCRHKPVSAAASIEVIARPTLCGSVPLLFGYIEWFGQKVSNARPTAKGSYHYRFGLSYFYGGYRAA